MPLGVMSMKVEMLTYCIVWSSKMTKILFTFASFYLFLFLLLLVHFSIAYVVMLSPLLKINTSADSPLFDILKSEKDVPHVWRTCAKVENSLEDGPRLANMSWRLWFCHQKMKLQQNTQEKTEDSLALQSAYPHLNVAAELALETDGTDSSSTSPVDFIHLGQPPSREHELTVQDINVDAIFIPQGSWNYLESNINYPELPPNLQHQQGLHLIPGYDMPLSMSLPSSPVLIEPLLPPYTTPQSPLGDSGHLYEIDSIETSDYLKDRLVDMQNNSNYFADISPSTGQLYNCVGQDVCPELPMDIDPYDFSEEYDQPVCTNCNATSTPLWRRSPINELLCNACGLYQKLHKVPRPKTLKVNTPRKEVREEDVLQLVCSNCYTRTTPLWRKDEEGASLCNACGLYLKLHNERRPLSMKTDTIKKRQRYEGGHLNKKHLKRPIPTLPPVSQPKSHRTRSFSRIASCFNTGNPFYLPSYTTTASTKDTFDRHHLSPLYYDSTSFATVSSLFTADLEVDIP
ncbi:hypothetical protein BDF14DRAFT_1098170 [Spinellus fusiger]|nr:hypothetical protein BDF14DRAFT_1098170 [Spinellus fusiger]